MKSNESNRASPGIIRCCEKCLSAHFRTAVARLPKPRTQAKLSVASRLGNPDLAEAEHILADYVELASSAATLTQTDDGIQTGRQPAPVLIGPTVN